jgi:hypothetical protein
MARGNAKFALHGGDEPDASSVNYHAAWKAFAFRRNLALLLVAAWIPLSVALFELTEYPIASLVVVGVWLASALAAVWWAGEFRCPRCRRRYAALGYRKGSNLTRGIFDRVCSNCKLRKFEIG